MPPAVLVVCEGVVEPMPLGERRIGVGDLGGAEKVPDF